MAAEIGSGAQQRDRSKSARTRARILDAAAAILSERGYVETRIGDVADLARLQGPAIYYHFPSRDAMIEEVVATGQRGVLDHVRSALGTAGTGPADRLRAAVTAHLEYVLTRSPYAAASIRTFAQLPADVQERQGELRREYGRLWRGLFDDAADAGILDPVLDPRAARLLVLGALNWTCEWWDPAKGDLGTLAAAARGFVLAALTGRAALPPAGPAGDDDPLPGPAEGARKSERTRRRALESAARVLGTRGYAGTRLSDVAREAGMRAASLYYHFPSRDDLIDEVVRTGVRMTQDHVTAAIAALPGDAGPLDRLDRAVEAHLSFCLAHPAFAVATIRNTGQLPPALRAREQESAAAYGDVWRALLADAQAAGALRPGTDPRILRMLVLGALNLTAEWPDPRVDAADVVRTARAMVRNAAAPPRETTVPAPDATADDATDPDLTAPDSTSPDSRASDSAAADTAAPDTAAPDNAAPDNAAPDNAAPAVPATGGASTDDPATDDPATGVPGASWSGPVAPVPATGPGGPEPGGDGLVPLFRPPGA